MSQVAQFIKDHQLDAMRMGGKKVGAGRSRFIEVLNPFTEQCIGTVPKATLEEVREAYAIAHAYKPTLSRYERAAILNKAAALVRDHLDDIANLITAEAGLCIKDAVYEAGRVSDVLLFGAQEVLKDDGQIFSCDLTHHGKQRRVYTQRAPLLGVITAITPFAEAAAVNGTIVLTPPPVIKLLLILLLLLFRSKSNNDANAGNTGSPRVPLVAPNINVNASSDVPRLKELDPFDFDLGVGALSLLSTSVIASAMARTSPKYP